MGVVGSRGRWVWWEAEEGGCGWEVGEGGCDGR